MIATSVPGRVTADAGADTWASTFATATAIPSGSPVQAAAAADSPPARAPSGASTRESFWSTTCSNRGSRAAKNVDAGNPSSADHSALYPAVHALRVSTPVSCHTIQSAASRIRSAASYTAGASRRTWSALGKNHSDEIRPPYRSSHGSPSSAATRLMSSASGCAAWCFQSLTQACGSRRQRSTWHSGVPSARVGRIVHAVKSIPRPMTSAGSMPASARADGTACRTAST